jgi:hypothetical protein
MENSCIFKGKVCDFKSIFMQDIIKETPDYRNMDWNKWVMAWQNIL